MEALTGRNYNDCSRVRLFYSLPDFIAVMHIVDVLMGDESAEDFWEYASARG